MSLRSRTLIALIVGAVLGFSGALAGNVIAERLDEDPRAASTGAVPWEEAHLLAEVFARIKGGLSDCEESVRRKILWANSEKLYKVPPPTAADEAKRLASIAA